MHHATSGNLDRRGVGDVDTLTVAEFRALALAAAAYRLTRSPLAVLGVGPDLHLRPASTGCRRRC